MHISNYILYICIYIIIFFHTFVLEKPSEWFARLATMFWHGLAVHDLYISAWARDTVFWCILCKEWWSSGHVCVPKWSKVLVGMGPNSRLETYILDGRVNFEVLAICWYVLLIFYDLEVLYCVIWTIQLCLFLGGNGKHSFFRKHGWNMPILNWTTSWDVNGNCFFFTSQPRLLDWALKESQILFGCVRK